MPTPEGAGEEEIGQGSGPGAQEGLAHACLGESPGEAYQEHGKGPAYARPQGHPREGPLKDQAELQSGVWVLAGSLARCRFGADVSSCPGDPRSLHSNSCESPARSLQAELVSTQSIASSTQAGGTKPAMPLVS